MNYNQDDTQETTIQPLGRTSATERDPITSEKFSFWLSDDTIVNPFDIVSVEQVNQPGEASSRSYGLVTTLEHRTDAPNHLANYISSNFGQLNEEPNTNRQGTTVASANVLSNTADIYMPVPSEKLVYFAHGFGQTSLVAGQRIAIGGALNTNTNPATFVPAAIMLQRQGVDGTLVANSVTITSGNTGSFQIQNNGLLGYVLGAPLTVKTSQMTKFINVNGLAGLQSAGTARLEVRGLILKDQTTGNPTMYAQWVGLQQ